MLRTEPYVQLHQLALRVVADSSCLLRQTKKTYAALYTFMQGKESFTRNEVR